MAKKIFLLCLAFLLSMHAAASAKEKGLPEEDRFKVAIEIKDSSRHKELPTAQNLELFLGNELVKKNLLNIVGTKIFGEPAQAPDDGLIIDEDRPVEQPPPEANLGELLIFDAVELPPPAAAPKDFDADAYRAQGTAYVVRCEVLALGVTKVEDKTIGTISRIIGSGLSFGGNSDSSRDKTLRRVGTAIGLGGFIETRRTAVNTVVNMQFISVETGQILWQQNFIGQAVKHHSPGDGYDNVWSQAYAESIEDSAKRISKRVNKYIDRVVIKGKSDKSFLPKKFSFSGLGGNMFF